jgi:hypothetical protein
MVRILVGELLLAFLVGTVLLVLGRQLLEIGILGEEAVAKLVLVAEVDWPSMGKLAPGGSGLIDNVTAHDRHRVQ